MIATTQACRSDCNLGLVVLRGRYKVFFDVDSLGPWRTAAQWNWRDMGDMRGREGGRNIGQSHL